MRLPFLWFLVLLGQHEALAEDQSGGGVNEIGVLVPWLPLWEAPGCWLLPYQLHSSCLGSSLQLMASLNPVTASPYPCRPSAIKSLLWLPQGPAPTLMGSRPPSPCIGKSSVKSCPNRRPTPHLGPHLENVGNVSTCLLQLV